MPPPRMRITFGAPRFGADGDSDTEQEPEASVKHFHDLFKQYHGDNAVFKRDALATKTPSNVDNFISENLTLMDEFLRGVVCRVTPADKSEVNLAVTILLNEIGKHDDAEIDINKACSQSQRSTFYKSIDAAHDTVDVEALDESNKDAIEQSVNRFFQAKHIPDRVKDIVIHNAVQFITKPNTKYARDTSIGKMLDEARLVHSFISMFDTYSDEPIQKQAKAIKNVEDIRAFIKAHHKHITTAMDKRIEKLQEGVDFSVADKIKESIIDNLNTGTYVPIEEAIEKAHQFYKSRLKVNELTDTISKLKESMAMALKRMRDHVDSVDRVIQGSEDGDMKKQLIACHENLTVNVDEIAKIYSESTVQIELLVHMLRVVNETLKGVADYGIEENEALKTGISELQATLGEIQTELGKTDVVPGSDDAKVE